MFTGIIKESGTVLKLERRKAAYRLTVASRDISSRAEIGESVAVNGVCLTLVEKKNGAISFDVMEETVRRSTISGFKELDNVNLEDALKAGSSIGGHFVSGHVDCVGIIKSIKREDGDSVMEIGFPAEFADLVVAKGSVAIDGVSLTVGEVKGGSFNVYLIPHTLKTTTLGSKKAGQAVNIEFDIIGKYASRPGSLRSGSRITEGFLKENGF